MSIIFTLFVAVLSFTVIYVTSVYNLPRWYKTIVSVLLTFVVTLLVSTNFRWI